MISQLAKCASTTLLILLAFASLAPRQASAQPLVTIDVPGATSTFISQINDLGEMVGYYTDTNGVFHGVLLSGGVFTTIDFSEAAGTVAAGINDSGQIVGVYTDASNVQHGFLYVNGTFTAVNNPAYQFTFPLAIDDMGNIVGYGADTQGVLHGFVLSNGTFTNVDFPGATSTIVDGTSLKGGSLAGTYTLPSSPANTFSGFTHINGQFATVTFPQSVSTGPNDINNSGQVAGAYTTSASQNAPFQGFLLSGTNFSTLDFPGATSTIANGLNDLGQIVGWYVDANNVTHGFLSSTGPFAYVAAGAGVSVVDTSTNLIVTTISVPGGPWALAITPDQKHVYVTDIGANNVSVIDTSTNQVVATVPVGNTPYSIAVAPNGNFAYVTNVDDRTVSVINTTSNTVVATVAVGNGPFACAVTPDSASVYVSNLYDGTISVINTANNTVAPPFPVSAPFGLAFTPTGSSAYVAAYANPGSVTALATPSNGITTTIPLGTIASPVTYPNEVAITPDATTAFVPDYGSGSVSVINTASNTVTATVVLPPGSTPFPVAITPDGTSAYVGDSTSATVSVIRTSDDTVTATVPMPNGVTGIAIASAAPTAQMVTQPLSPTLPNTFNFGTNAQTVQYPAGTNFTNVVMNTVAQQITQGEFQQRVAGTQFAKATCLVYSGNGGNCVDYMVTCTDGSGTPITCPSTATPTIGVATVFSTSQGITNPCYLTTPIGKNDWRNIFVSLEDTRVKGRTRGFSEFVACDLGATNAQGLAQLHIFVPLRPTDGRRFTVGQSICVYFNLKSVANGTPVTDAKGGLTLTRIANADGTPVSQLVLSNPNVYDGATMGTYRHELNTTGYLPGTYLLTIYGNAFPAYEVQFRLVK